MVALLNSTMPILGIPSSFLQKPISLPALSCFRNNGDVSGLHEQRLEVNKNEDISKSLSDDGQNVKHDNIWQLFREAQQNILYLNNQRLGAIEELNKIKKEKQSILDKIKKLEAVKQESADKLSICSELLLRIDSMVLGNVISLAEASDFRSLVLHHKVSVADVFNVISHKRDSELVGELRHFSDQSKKNGFHIIHICTEMTPLVSRGSVASYVTGIARALQRKGHLAEVILPKYACLDLDEVQGLREVNVEVYSYFNGQLHGNRIWTGVVYGVGVTLIEPLDHSSFFSREMIYGYPDDFERFSYFCRASLDYIVKCGKQPDILHLHNWETAIVAPLFWDVFVNKGLGGTRILLTIHNFNSQGTEQPDKLALCGLDPSSLHCPDRLQDNTNTQLVNILKGGVVYSNRVVIMSSIHPKHAIIRNLSNELEPTLNVHGDKLSVAPYGFEKSTWDPQTDYFLPENFNAENMNGKAVCKVALLQRLGLSEHSSTILVGCSFSEGADIDEKKMKDIVLNAKKHDVQFIFMETSERPDLNQALESLHMEFKDDDNIKFVRSYDEALSHLLFAGSDSILCRSFHDPTDETPLKALRYGAVPIAVDSDSHTNRNFINHDQEATKYSKLINNTFGNMSLGLAIDELRSNPSKWKRRIMEAMAHDLSWDGECYEVHVAAYSAIKNM
ncbi:putative starch synthase [Medicago truncatula]|uniref:starch synthase n=1 Tax=Medicago truncatula TaxID=3880 RepID=A0A396HQK0_MEDTR|nr:probable starch synthase 4, chloroplastic/amyloplastic isoform X2 [Medicago truncatula]RHN54858.1 putative starch synthase [Medicago truncatula]